MKLDPQMVLAIVAILGVLVNTGAMLLQSRRDRVDAAAKLATTATSMLPALEHRVGTLEKDNDLKTRLVEKQGKQIESLMHQTDEYRAELRAVKADRDQLLAKVLILQNENKMIREARDTCHQEIQAAQIENASLKARVDEMSFKLDRLMGLSTTDADDIRG